MASLSVPQSASLQKTLSSSKYVFDATTALPQPELAAEQANESSVPAGRPLERKRSSLPALDTSALQVPTAAKASVENRRRSTSALAPGMGKPVTKRLTKNYKNLVKDYNIMKKYAKQPDGTYASTTLCAFCEVVRPRIVFFPCQHMCVCDHCLTLNDITCEPTSPSSWTACPVCMTDIRLMLPVTGNEEDIYWQWALQVPPELPLHFKSEFRSAGRKLRGSSSSIQPDADRSTSEHADEKQSDQASHQPPRHSSIHPRLGHPRLSMQSLRRFSIPVRRSSTGGVPSAADGKCSIL